VVFLGEAGKARIDFREIVSYNPLLSFLIKRGVAKIKATSTDLHKETDSLFQSKGEPEGSEG